MCIRDRYYSTSNIDVARTVTFTAISLSTLAYVFSIRSLNSTPTWSSITSNVWLLGAVIMGIVLQGIPLFVPYIRDAFLTQHLYVHDWLIVFAEIISVVVFIEISKLLFRRLDTYHR